jgi:ubiquinone biosynthesis protein COQ9
MMDLHAEREKFINHSIDFVLRDGWTTKALENTSVSLVGDVLFYRTIFPNIKDVVDFFEMQEDIKMLDRLQKYDKLIKTRDKIRCALIERIVHILGGKDMMRELESFYLYSRMSTEFTAAICHTWRTADVIWKFAGDNSMNFNYYTKRSLLSGVYIKSIRYYLHKNSENIEEYISGALEKVIKLGSYKKYLKIPKLEDIPIARMFS